MLVILKNFCNLQSVKTKRYVPCVEYTLNQTQILRSNIIYVGSWEHTDTHIVNICV